MLATLVSPLGQVPWPKGLTMAGKALSMKEARLQTANFFSSDLLTCFEPDQTFTIAFFGTEEVQSPKGVETKVVLRFEETHLGLVLSQSRLKQLQAVAGDSPVGAKIRLGVENGNRITILAAIG